MAKFGTHVEDDMVLLDNKLKQLKNEYEQYFLGTRKRPPHMLRVEVNKMITFYANISIQNTRQRFQFNNLRARYSSFKRLWDDTMRKIEEGRYERHVFKADLHERVRNARAERERQRAASDPGPRGDDLFEAYRSAREATGQGTAGLTQEKLQGVLARQEAAIREKTGCERVRFRVVVEGGKAKLKATPVRA